MPLKTAEANRLLDDSLGVSPAADRWIALLTVAPTNDTDGTEVTGGSYARQQVTFDAAADRAATLAALETWPTATADWGLIVAAAVMDALSGGNQRWWIPFPADQQRTIASGEIFELPDSGLTLGFGAT